MSDEQCGKDQEHVWRINEDRGIFVCLRCGETEDILPTEGDAA